MTDHPHRRDFAATPAQLYRAHTDPDLYARGVGPNDITTRDVGVNDGYAKLDTLLAEI